MAAHPVHKDFFYLLTDRGPNFNGPDKGDKVFPVADFTPQIGLFRLCRDSLKLLHKVEMCDSEGAPVSGLPNPADMGGTGENALDLVGNELGTDPVGLDPEGLIALGDGTFWVSDEYGPHIVHFDATGKTIERINAFGTGTGGRTLPAVFKNRRANRGMEGLTITPDGSTLVGIMQSSLYNPASKKADIKDNCRVTRIVTFEIETGNTKQYLYIQDKPSLSNSEIRALTNSEFVVLERDGKFPEASNQDWVKRFYKIDISVATDVSDPSDGENGLLVEGKTLEECTLEEIEAAGITPVAKELWLDLATVDSYSHDKPEGFEVIEHNGEKIIAVVNDDDFGIVANSDGTIGEKILPITGKRDRNILYFFPIDMTTSLRPVSIESLSSSDLVQCKHNPGSRVLHLNYNLVSANEITISLFSLKGEMVYSACARKFHAPGQYGFKISTENLATGAYFLNFQNGSSSQIRKINVIR